MRNNILRILYGLVLFCAVFVLLVYFSEETGTNTTTQLQDPVLPVVYMEAGSTVFNALHGVVTQQDAGRMRSVLTPVSSEREITVRINPYGGSVLSAAMEVRDIGGERLIEDGELAVTLEEDILTADIAFQNLIDPDTEYLLVLILETEECGTVRYYTRIVYSESQEEQEEALGALAFARNFHEATFGDAAYAELLTYLEPDENEENDSFQRVTLYSSTELVTWGELSPECVTEPVYSLVDRQGSSYGIRGSYYITAETEDGEILCRVEEYYELEKGTDRFYLMDYERTVSQDFDPENMSEVSDALDLGIADEELQAVKDESGNTLAFVHDGRLFSVQAQEKLMIYVFGFDRPGDTGERETYAGHDIRILNVEEDGSIDFIVYGYMNSGTHEGQIGRAFYHYSGEHHTLEEKVYLPYDGSWELLRLSLEQMCYYNPEEGKLYLIMNDSLYEIDVEGRTLRMVEDGLSGRQAVMSDSGRFIACTDSDEEGAERLILLDLESLSQREIVPEEGSVVPLGFLGEDLIYGIVEQDSLVEDSAGMVFAPMSGIYIADEELNVLEEYVRDGIYITDVAVQDNQVTLTRVQRVQDGESGTQYEMIGEDEIVSSVKEETEVYTQVTAVEPCENTVQILIDNVQVSSLRYMRPQEIVYEGSRELSARGTSSGDGEETRGAGHYYIYSLSGLEAETYQPDEAVTLAYGESGGVVLDDGSTRLWESSRPERAELEELTEMAEGAALGDSIALCLEAILDYENLSGQADVAAQLAEGNSAYEILTDALSETGAQVLDLSGCELDAVLYYVGAGTPVYAMTDSSRAVLIIGYGPENVELYDPSAGSVYLMTTETAQLLFESAGNRFICYAG